LGDNGLVNQRTKEAQEMLSVEDRFMIKQMYDTGVSVSEIARRTGHDRKTIRAIVKEPLLKESQPRVARASKLDPFVTYLLKRIEAGVLNATKLYQEIVAQGYTGKVRIVRDFVRPHRETQRRAAEATMRFETQPGEQAQVDWGHFGTLVHQGQQRKLYAFVMTLGWSRAMYLEYTASVDTAWWLRCHIHAFDYLGGVPETVLHDNLKTAVLSRDLDGRIHWNPRYLDFACYYGFQPKACAPYRARTKGKVENGVRYVRGNFWPGLSYTTLADLNHQAGEWLAQTANARTHGTTGKVPWEQLPAEHLRPLHGKPPYDTSVLGYRRSSRDCVVSYAGNFYSVPATHSQQQLQVKETEAGELIITTVAGVEIARHMLVQGYHERVIVAEHYASLQKPARRRRTAEAEQIVVADDATAVAHAPLVERRPLSQYEAFAEGEV
jgi:transposase